MHSAARLLLFCGLAHVPVGVCVCPCVRRSMLSCGLERVLVGVNVCKPVFARAYAVSPPVGLQLLRCCYGARELLV